MVTIVTMVSTAPLSSKIKSIDVTIKATQYMYKSLS